MGVDVVGLPWRVSEEFRFYLPKDGVDAAAAERLAELAGRDGITEDSQNYYAGASYKIPVFDRLNELANKTIIPALQEAPAVYIAGEHSVLLDTAAISPEIVERAVQLNLLHPDSSGVENVYRLHDEDNLHPGDISSLRQAAVPEEQLSAQPGLAEAAQAHHK